MSTTNVGVLAASLSLDSSAFTAGANQAKGALGGLKIATDATFGGMEGAAKKTGGAFDAIKKNLKNLGFQAQEAAVQLQGGTAALTVLAQQGSQVAGIFGPGGAVVGALLAVGATAASVFLAMSDGAERAAGSIKRLDDAAKDVKATLLGGGDFSAFSKALATLAPDDRTIETGILDDRLKELKARIEEGRTEVQASLKGLQDDLARPLTRGDVVGGQRERVLARQAVAKDLADLDAAYKLGETTLQGYVAGLDGLSDRLKAAGPDAEAAAAAIRVLTANIREQEKLEAEQRSRLAAAKAAQRPAPAVAFDLAPAANPFASTSPFASASGTAIVKQIEAVAAADEKAKNQAVANAAAVKASLKDLEIAHVRVGDAVKGAGEAAAESVRRQGGTAEQVAQARDLAEATARLQQEQTAAAKSSRALESEAARLARSQKEAAAAATASADQQARLVASVAKGPVAYRDTQNAIERENELRKVELDLSSEAGRALDAEIARRQDLETALKQVTAAREVSDRAADNQRRLEALGQEIGAYERLERTIKAEAQARAAGFDTATPQGQKQVQAQLAADQSAAVAAAANAARIEAEGQDRLAEALAKGGAAYKDQLAVIEAENQVRGEGIDLLSDEGKERVAAVAAVKRQTQANQELIARQDALASSVSSAFDRAVGNISDTFADAFSQIRKEGSFSASEVADSFAEALASSPEQIAGGIFASFGQSIADEISKGLQSGSITDTLKGLFTGDGAATYATYAGLGAAGGQAYASATGGSATGAALGGAVGAAAGYYFFSGPIGGAVGGAAGAALGGALGGKTKDSQEVTVDLSAGTIDFLGSLSNSNSANIGLAKQLGESAIAYTEAVRALGATISDAELGFKVKNTNLALIGEEVANKVRLKTSFSDPVYQQILQSSKANSIDALLKDLSFGDVFKELSGQSTGLQTQMDALVAKFGAAIVQAEKFGLSTDALRDNLAKGQEDLRRQAEDTVRAFLDGASGGGVNAGISDLERQADAIRALAPEVGVSLEEVNAALETNIARLYEQARADVASFVNRYSDPGNTGLAEEVAGIEAEFRRLVPVAREAGLAESSLAAARDAGIAAARQSREDLIAGFLDSAQGSVVQGFKGQIAAVESAYDQAAAAARELGRSEADLAVARGQAIAAARAQAQAQIGDFVAGASGGTGITGQIADLEAQAADMRALAPLVGVAMGEIDAALQQGIARIREQARAPIDAFIAKYQGGTALQQQIAGINAEFESLVPTARELGIAEGQLASARNAGIAAARDAVRSQVQGFIDANTGTGFQGQKRALEQQAADLRQLAPQVGISVGEVNKALSSGIAKMRQQVEQQVQGFIASYGGGSLTGQIAAMRAEFETTSAAALEAGVSQKGLAAALHQGIAAARNAARQSALGFIAENTGRGTIRSGELDLALQADELKRLGPQVGVSLKEINAAYAEGVRSLRADVLAQVRGFISSAGGSGSIKTEIAGLEEEARRIRALAPQVGVSIKTVNAALRQGIQDIVNQGKLSIQDFAEKTGNNNPYKLAKRKLVLEAAELEKIAPQVGLSVQYVRQSLAKGLEKLFEDTTAPIRDFKNTYTVGKNELLDPIRQITDAFRLAADAARQVGQKETELKNIRDKALDQLLVAANDNLKSAALDVKGQFEGLLNPYREVIRSVTSGQDSQLSPRDQLEALTERFYDTQFKAGLDDTKAIQDLPGIAQNLLAFLNQYGSSADTGDLRGSIEFTLQSILDQQEDRQKKTLGDLYDVQEDHLQATINGFKDLAAKVKGLERAVREAKVA